MHVLIVEDEYSMVEVLEAYLVRDGHEVSYALNGADGLKQFRVKRPDFIILDLMLPDLSGESVLQEVRREADTPVLILSAKSAEEERVQGMLLGADDYVVKPFSPREVMVRIQAIMRRFQKQEEQSEVWSFGGGRLRIRLNERRVICGGEEVHLTPIEYRLLTAMARHPGWVYERAELLEKVQEDLFFEGYERSIDVHVKNLRKKIEVDPRHPEWVETVFGMGYRFRGERDV
ncbi:response regulator transcription factor [Alkalicoccus urumqiensis]|uniref:DNA-binding response regulator n=1 Tax=Alkalicoccus urumqiensis TaxID=1548213 RepID=A0A2P6MJN5_ALKUR|nr:response regulator transcription factor [Alkalicoccus urumqiensis]PRO66484.1 DNA-binding response regulator [Alkalicoccus urumqiensis]